MPLPASDHADVAHRVFSPERLSIGLTLPLLRSGHTVADFNEQLELAALADSLGFRALWIRDVPLDSAGRATARRPDRREPPEYRIAHRAA